jgi:hypothetical protein
VRGGGDEVELRGGWGRQESASSEGAGDRARAVLGQGGCHSHLECPDALTHLSATSCRGASEVKEGKRRRRTVRQATTQLSRGYRRNGLLNGL